jgi:hypothetical protein
LAALKAAKWRSLALFWPLAGAKKEAAYPIFQTVSPRHFVKKHKEKAEAAKDPDPLR